MELRHLRYFVAVADTLSFTQAAADCAVAQSALSQQIARLEKDVGAILFTRSSRQVRLTEAGAVLLPWARRLLSDAEQAAQDVQALSGLRRGRLRLGVAHAVPGAFDLAGALAEFRAEHPGVEISLGHDTSEALLSSVLAGEFDLVFTDLGLERVPTGLGHRVLHEDRLVAVVSAGHHLAQRGHVDLVELSDDEFIWPGRGTGLRSAVEAACTRAGVTPRQNFEVGPVGEMVRLAAHGLGVAVVPASATAESAAESTVESTAEPTAEPEAATAAGARTLQLADPQAVYRVLLVHPADRLSAAATALIGVIGRRRGDIHREHISD